MGKRTQKLKKRKENMKKKRSKCGFWEHKEKTDFAKRDACFKLYDASKTKADKAAKGLSTDAKKLQVQTKKEKTIKAQGASGAKQRAAIADLTAAKKLAAAA